MHPHLHQYSLQERKIEWLMYLYVHPQSASWKEFQPPKTLTSLVISCVRGDTLTMGSLIRLPKCAKKYWRDWEEYCRKFNRHPHLTNASDLENSIILPTFLDGSGYTTTAANIKSQFKRSQTRSHLSPISLSWLDNTVRCPAHPQNKFSQSNVT